MASAADILKRADPKETPLKTVQLDAQVVLKVMQHCDNALPQLVTGQLLGLDVGHTLEITDCFPFPVRCRFSVFCCARTARRRGRRFARRRSPVSQRRQLLQHTTACRLCSLFVIPIDTVQTPTNNNNKKNARWAARTAAATRRPAARATSSR